MEKVRVIGSFKQITFEYAGLKAESEKRGLGSSIEIKLFRLEMSAEGSKAICNKKTTIIRMK